MKLSTIYRKAAERIDSGNLFFIFETIYCCPDVREYIAAKAWQTFIEYFPDWWEGHPVDKETRVLALLFMVAICESEGN